MNKIGIYKITSPTNKIYIGQSTNICLREKYYNRLSCKKQPKLYNSLFKYGFNNHKFEIIEECLVEQLNERETYWKQHYINQLGWNNMLFCELYDTGGGPKNENTRKLMSEAKIGISRDEKTKLKLKKPKSKKHIDNISKGKLGKPNLLSRKPIHQYDLQGNFIKEYDSYTSAKNTTKINGINNVVKGISKTAGGYYWKYKTIN
jgi:group I intron endonuclease